MKAEALLLFTFLIIYRLSAVSAAVLTQERQSTEICTQLLYRRKIYQKYIILTQMKILIKMS